MGGRRSTPVVDIVRFFWAVGDHIFRRSARWGWSIAAIAIILYAALAVWFPAAVWTDTARQGLLILASVSIGFVLLPELPSTLWSLDVNRVRNLIPEKRRDALSQTLIQAETSDGSWSKQVWEEALEPLKIAAREPWRYVTDMKYAVTVHLGQKLELESGTIHVSSLRVDQTSLRVLERDDVFDSWVSIVRTKDALDDEFKAGECLARELVPLPGLEGPEWQAAVIKHVQVKMHVDDRRIEFTPIAHRDTDIVRWKAVDFTRHKVRVRLHISINTPMDPAERTFPVMFKGYYCAGVTEISLKLYPGKAKTALKGDYFVGRALQSQPPPDAELEEDDLCQHLRYSTGLPRILWPGSGVLFHWGPPK